MSHTTSAGGGREPGRSGSGETKSGGRLSGAAKLFDVRFMIGGLFVVYGVMLTVAGFFTSKAELRKADNININLWMGLVMLGLGLVFLLWQRLNPLVPPSHDEDTALERPSGPVH